MAAFAKRNIKPIRERFPHQDERKKLGRAAELRHGRKVEWVGGILYFTGTRIEVPDVPHVPKPGREALGYAGAQPTPKAKEPDYHRIAAE